MGTKSCPPYGLADKGNAAALAFYRKLGFDDSLMKVLRKDLQWQESGSDATPVT